MSARNKDSIARDRAVLAYLRVAGASTHGVIAAKLKTSKRNVMLSLGRLAELGLVLACKTGGATRWEASASRIELELADPEPASEAPARADDAPVPAGTTALYRRRLTPAHDDDDDLLDFEAGRSPFMDRARQGGR